MAVTVDARPDLEELKERLDKLRGFL